jgi:hypothetical protein
MAINKLACEVDGKGRNNLIFFCPGCGYYHSFRVSNGGDESIPVWEWNGSMDKPTFSPSLMVNRGTDSQCHSFVRNGQIQYLDDCWHSLKNTTVEIPEIDW